MAGVPQVPPPAAPAAAPARASWLALIIVTAIGAVLAPFYFLMAAFSGHALLTGGDLSAEGLLVFATGAASVVCPVLAWVVQFAGGGRRTVYALALVPLAAVLLASALGGLTMPGSTGPGSSGLIVTPAAK